MISANAYNDWYVLEKRRRMREFKRQSERKRFLIKAEMNELVLTKAEKTERLLMTSKNDQRH